MKDLTIYFAMFLNFSELKYQFDGFESSFVESGNYEKLLKLDKKNLEINDLIKPLYSS